MLEEIQDRHGNIVSVRYRNRMSSTPDNHVGFGATDREDFVILAVDMTCWDGIRIAFGPPVNNSRDGPLVPQLLGTRQLREAPSGFRLEGPGQQRHAPSDHNKATRTHTPTRESGNGPFSWQLTGVPNR